MDTPALAPGPRISHARVVFGLVVMALGALLLADRLDWGGWRMNVPLWPWILIIIGIVRLTDRSTGRDECVRSRRSAAWFLFVGGWGLMNEHRLFGIHYGQSWPLLLIGAGLLVVWHAIDRATPAPVRREP